jgi:hypothetical protein
MGMCQLELLGKLCTELWGITKPKPMGLDAWMFECLDMENGYRGLGSESEGLVFGEKYLEGPALESVSVLVYLSFSVPINKGRIEF